MKKRQPRTRITKVASGNSLSALRKRAGLLHMFQDGRRWSFVSCTPDASGVSGPTSLSASSCEGESTSLLLHDGSPPVTAVYRYWPTRSESIREASRPGRRTRARDGRLPLDVVEPPGEHGPFVSSGVYLYDAAFAVGGGNRFR